MKVTASRYHDFSAGHRVYQHESKCAHLHGHNYRIHFEIEGDKLDPVGRVLDFGVIKSILCTWLEDTWDHKFLVFSEDPWSEVLKKLDSSVVVVPFNPTAENMGIYLMENVAPDLLQELNCKLVSCRIEETRKCSVEISEG